jgi:hypothetical protein
MLVKSSFKGTKMGKYQIAAILLKLGLLTIFIFNIIIPFGNEFLEIIQQSIDSEIWNIKAILIPIGKILLYFVILTAIEAIIVFAIIFPLAKSELSR